MDVLEMGPFISLESSYNKDRVMDKHQAGQRSSLNIFTCTTGKIKEMSRQKSGFMLKENGLTSLHDHTHCRLTNHNWVKNMHVQVLSGTWKHYILQWRSHTCGWIQYSLTSASNIQRSKSSSARDISILGTNTYSSTVCEKVMDGI